ncbi:hypothetical protein OPV22_019072 [Ensete ventricosum]|uniref:Uncharacterized protein n=1 Tax=Ensete ventricosum TaxID=4639 RepID=A0AAV8QVM2_ENSVE|nr:hypothetical protein OPV22_019072 [Ensete ventricosum]
MRDLSIKMGDMEKDYFRGDVVKIPSSFSFYVHGDQFPREQTSHMSHHRGGHEKATRTGISTNISFRFLQMGAKRSMSMKTAASEKATPWTALSAATASLLLDGRFFSSSLLSCAVAGWELALAFSSLSLANS